MWYSAGVWNQEVHSDKRRCCEMKRPIRPGFPICALAVCLLLLSSCSNDECGPVCTTALRDTPTHLIGSLAKTIETKDIEAYFTCLDDSYRFVFVEEDYDAAGVTPQQPYWTKCPDLEAMTHMFRDSRVMNVTCTLTVNGGFTGPDTLLACTCNVDFIVTIEYEEPVTYWAHRSLLHFTLAPDRGDAKLWVVRQILEEVPGDFVAYRMPKSRVAVQTTTVGVIKAMFK
jgi:hypothetical protein